MRITRDHAPWAAVTFAVVLGCSGAYALYVTASPHGPSGGSWPGLFLGIAGTLCMFLAAFLSLRKRLVLLRLGNAQLWMKIHLWLGLLAVPLILMHAGFRLGGTLTATLMMLLAVVVASGVLGLVMQHVVPRWLTANVPLETVYGQIEHVLGGLRVSAYEAVAAVAGPVAGAEEEQQSLAREAEMQERLPGSWKAVARQRPAQDPPPEAAALQRLYLTQVRPYLRGEGVATAASPDVFAVAADLPDDWGATLEKLADLCDECRQLRVQRRLHHALHGWLFVHAPLSLALLVLALVHAVVALRY
jgi:hypothetical protein